MVTCWQILSDSQKVIVLPKDDEKAIRIISQYFELPENQRDIFLDGVITAL